MIKKKVIIWIIWGPWDPFFPLHFLLRLLLFRLRLFLPFKCFSFHFNFRFVFCSIEEILLLRHADDHISYLQTTSYMPSKMYHCFRKIFRKKEKVFWFVFTCFVIKVFLRPNWIVGTQKPPWQSVKSPLPRVNPLRANGKKSVGWPSVRHFPFSCDEPTKNYYITITTLFEKSNFCPKILFW